MAEEKMIRLGQASRKLNVGHNTILEFLAKKGFSVENNPNAKLSPDQFAMLSKEFAASASEKMEASNLTIGTKHVENVTIQNEVEVHRKKTEEEERIMIKNLGSKEVVKAKEKEVAKEEPKPEKVEREKPKLEGIKVLGKIELDQKKKEEPIAEQPKVDEELIKAKADKLKGLKVVDRIELPVEKKKEAPSTNNNANDDRKKRPRKRIPTPPDTNRGAGQQGGGSGPRPQHQSP